MKEEKKYKFTGETMEFEGHTLRRIQYLQGTDYIGKGSIGGWIESEENLSHKGQCAIRCEAKVFGHARVMEDAVICDEAIVKDSAIVKGDSYICINTVIGADTIVSGESHISGDSKIFFYADEEYGRPNISGVSELYNCIIEATGEVIDSELENKNLSGFLNLRNIISISEESPLYEKV